MSSGQKGRKIGRNANRPSQKRYVGEKRSVKNKARNIARHEKRMAKKGMKLIARSRRPMTSYT